MGPFVKRLAWRLSRLLGIVATIVLATGVVYAAGFSSAPHAEEALTPFERSRLEVEFNLTPGAQRTEVFDSAGRQMGVLNTSVDREIIAYEQTYCAGVAAVGL